jgi:hypothetical protein
MGISTEYIPKSTSRVLDAAKIHAEYKQKKHAWMEGEVDDANDHNDHMGGASKPPPPPHKKRRMDARAGAGAEKSRVLTTKGPGKEHHHLVDTRASIEIQPGELLKHFNQ